MSLSLLSLQFPSHVSFQASSSATPTGPQCDELLRKVGDHPNHHHWDRSCATSVSNCQASQAVRKPCLIASPLSSASWFNTEKPNETSLRRSVYKEYDDGPKGFYTVFSQLFAEIDQVLVIVSIFFSFFFFFDCCFL